ncbi:hypothetical protein BVC93_14915 [Mycobacterium sp. MS1601]|uniref:DUF456 domain-containing protein n=1 Tax=Mycobacterium sp. MS1601 TaxID=1936029 RepID=UPI0009797FFD|nr:DUF456 domain-containing protein [Mycobacterium sp. MS1601]AQA03484.1 hypothetical protein BVC93_14915 [Mycobacterium sp. MS1601]
MGTSGIVLVALAIAVGLAGIIVPILPGGLLVFGAIAVWAWVEGTTAAWVTLGIVAALFVTAEVIKYVWPVKRMKQADVRTWSLVLGAVLGVIGFFVVPVLGLVLGFILGVFLAELGVRRDATRAWVSTVHALKGVALSVGVELVGALASTVVWIVAVMWA